jgi:peptidoglycan/LPS O-acetylase OafA/YrhL
MKPGAFRFLLASAVVVHHFSSFAIGHAAVYLFFILSGYWITQMWEAKYSKTASPYVTFVASRYWRLWPVFIVCSLGMLVWRPLPASLADLTPSIFLVGYATATYQPLYPAWSLDFEMQFYLLAPLLCIGLRRAPAATIGAVGVVSLTAAITFGMRSMLTLLPFFVIGMVAARWRALPGRRLAIASATAAVLLLGVFALVPALRPVLFGGTARAAAFAFNEHLNVALALAAVPFALHTVTVPADRRDALLSDWSFSLYLFHVIPLVAMAKAFPWIPKLPAAERLPYVAAALAVAYGGSILITLLVDRPTNRARSAFVRGREQKNPRGLPVAGASTVGRET